MSLASPKVSRLDLLRDRAQMLGEVRHFFAERGVLEVDTGLLSLCAPVDTHIDPVSCVVNGEMHYLATSPEYRMKELLVEGAGDIYQLSHVFRDNESGRYHKPEFTMCEWYRVGISFEALIEESVSFVELFLGERRLESYTYREAFEEYGGCSPEGLSESEEMLLFATRIEPSLPRERIVLIRDFPAKDAALAQVRGGVAMRFELFCSGLELANGYEELSDPQEHHRRFEAANIKRSLPLPIDNTFLAALEKGLPPCCGVAVGFDRLMMARHGSTSLTEILA